jgi:hypothetical protein
VEELEILMEELEILMDLIIETLRFSWTFCKLMRIFPNEIVRCRSLKIFDRDANCRFLGIDLVNLDLK